MHIMKKYVSCKRNFSVMSKVAIHYTGDGKIANLFLQELSELVIHIIHSEIQGAMYPILLKVTVDDS